MVTRTKRNRGTGAAPRGTRPSRPEARPPWVWGSNLGGIPLGKEEATRPLSMVPES